MRVGGLIVGEAGYGAGYDHNGRVNLVCLGVCSCPNQGDLDGNGSIDSVDLSLLIDVVFLGGFDPKDPDCPTTRSDLNCDDTADSVDLSLMIDHVFFGGPGPCDPCGI